MKNLSKKIRARMIFIIYPLLFFPAFIGWEYMTSLQRIIFSLFLLGGGLNFLVMAVNGFSMPITKLCKGKQEGYHNINKKTKLSYLSDIFILIIPLRKRDEVAFFSIGDTFIYIAIMTGIMGVLSFLV